MAKLIFLGAAGTVTGSKHLLQWESENHTRRILVDCGMFQGLKELRLRNWEPLPVNPELIDAVILTHPHIDHIGYLPRLVKDGFDGPVYASAATCDMAEIMLRDSAHIQEEDTRLARKYGFSKHKDPQPLYTLEDAEKVFSLLCSIGYRKPQHIFSDALLELRHSGHILGSAFVELTVEEKGKAVKVVFSGDVGRYNQPLLKDPDPPTDADYLLLECTYGDRTHDDADPKSELGAAIAKTLKRGGSAVIPAFALGRSQMMLQYIAELTDEGVIPEVPVYLDSPMAVATTWKTRSHEEELDEHTLSMVHSNSLFKRSNFHYLTTRDQSMKLNNRKDPCIIISASGMATAGRVLHHLARLMPDRKNSVILVGYQVEGSRGRHLIEGAKSVKIHGQHVDVNAEVINLASMSGHADYSEMMPWLGKMKEPRMTFLIHGEISGLTATRDRLLNELGWDSHIPELNEEYDLAPLREVKTVFAAGDEKPAYKMPSGAVAIILTETFPTPNIANLPGTVVFREKPSRELADRLANSRIFHEAIVYTSPGKTGKSAEPGLNDFTASMRKNNIRVWQLKEVG